MDARFLRHGTLCCALLSLSCHGTALAQSMDQEALQALVLKQAEQIAILQHRLDSLEGRDQSTGPASPASLAQRPASTPVSTEATTQQPDIKFTRGAPVFTSADGRRSFRPRGRIQLDASSTSGSRFADRNISGTEGRSARLGGEGSIGSVEYAVEGEFADGAVVWKSAYIAVPHHIAGKDAELTIGQRLNDRGMEGSSSGTTVPFAERSVVAGVTQPVRGYFGIGLTERLYGERWHASLSATGDGLGSSGSTNDTLVISTRAHWNPYRDQGNTIHLGVWGFYEGLADDAEDPAEGYRIANHFNDQLRISPGEYGKVDRTVAYGLEAGGVYGKTWVMGEWAQRKFEGPLSDAPTSSARLSTYVVSAGWFLHGGIPGYSAKTGVWSNPKVSSWVSDGGIGAWELVARYENLDLGDFPQGGTGHAVTAGVNWYVSPLVRVILNVARWQTDNASGDFQGPDNGYSYNARMQLAF